MMAPVTHYGVVGCGMMGQEHLRNIALLPGSCVAAICEPDAQMAQHARCLAPHALMTDSLEALLEVENLDCILIATPNFLHVDQMMQIAAKRPLPLLVEKPLFTDDADMARLADFEARFPAPVQVAMEYRYMPPIAALLEAAGTITGGIRMLTIREHRFPFLKKVGNWNRFNRYSGGTFVEKCCHFFDLMRLALGAEPVRIMASGGQGANHLDEAYAQGVPDILDHGYVIVDFDSGQRAMLELCMFAEGSIYQEDISAVGPHGRVEACIPGPWRFWPPHLGAPPVPKVIFSPRTPPQPEIREIPVDPVVLRAGDHNGATFYQHQKFLEVVRGRRAVPEVSLNDGRMAVLMGLAAQKSIAEKRMVDMPSPGLAAL